MKAAIMGLGMVADTHLAALRGAGIDVAYAMGRRADAAQSFAAKHSITGSGTDLSELIATQPDFVLLLTPPDARRDYVHALCQAGLPILMEKPIERTFSDAETIVQHCETTRVPLGVMLQHRMRPAAQRLQSELPSLGRMATVDLRVPWWREQSYYDTPGRGTFARDGGGVLITQAIHQIDLMLSLCGPVRQVSALRATSPLHAMEAEDFAAATMRFDSGAVGSLMASVTHYPGFPETLTLNGTEGSATLSANMLRLERHGEAAETEGSAGGSGGGADPMAFSHAWHQSVIEDFAAALREGRPPQITGRSALPAHALIDAIQEAARSGQATQVPHV